ncbi:hypothetical protein C2I06_19795 [Niallia circulans]|uniref:hypothetical protein n=1 Tax=Niallia circulans TaxID=1397 RepID=UPI000F450CB1|nr:hypothetical protein [Niallia circulans]AYV68916.1 hypothetical protein C2I06_19795 [Niallia circulans]
MEVIQNLFDPYELKARISPAILTLLPLCLSTILWYPNLLDALNTTFTLAGIIIILFVFSKVSRNMGFKKQKRLLKEWGGFPTTIMLRHTDPTLDPLTKERYHNFLKEKVPNIKMPTQEEELEDQEYYDINYNSAVAWLRENTRDKTIYPILHVDNANYGFARNTYGIKVIGIFVCILSIGLNVFGIYQKYGISVLSVPFKFWVSVSLSIVLLVIWLFLINKKWVRNYADAYARTLLATCESRN